MNDEPLLDEPLLIAIPGAHRDPAAIGFRMCRQPRASARSRGTGLAAPRWKPGAQSRSSPSTRTTATPSSADAARSTSARMPQSWSPAGSSMICRTFQTSGLLLDQDARAAMRASGPVPMSSCSSK